MPSSGFLTTNAVSTVDRRMGCWFDFFADDSIRVYCLTRKSRNFDACMFYFSPDPSVISWTYLLQFSVLAPLAISALKTNGARWYEAIDLNKVHVRTTVLWMMVWMLCFVCAVSLYGLLPHTPDPFLLAIKDTKHVGFTLTALVLAPLLEEILFRAGGFRLWRHTRLGLTGTLLVTSLLFALIHVGQYSWQLLLLMFAFGILLGLAREKTGSLLPALILHALNNLVVVIAVAWVGVVP